MTSLYYSPITGLVGWKFENTETVFEGGLTKEKKEEIKKDTVFRTFRGDMGRTLQKMLRKLPPDKRKHVQKTFQWNLLHPKDE